MTTALPTVAITGGTGFVGQGLCSRLARAGYSLRLLRRPEFDLLAPVNPELLAGCAAVIHLAAAMPTNQWDLEEAQRCWQTNALGTLRLVEAMQRAGVRCLIQTTSANAYAPGNSHPAEHWQQFPVLRAPYYLSSKMVQEVFAHNAACRYEMKVTTLRLSSVYGRGQATGPVVSFAKALLGGAPVRLSNGGGFGADFVAIGDVGAVVEMMLAKSAAGISNIFNVGSGVRTTMLELAHKLADLIGASPDLIELTDGGEVADEGFASLDISRVMTMGFAPTSLHEGLSELVAWLRLGQCKSAARDLGAASIPLLGGANIV